MDPLNSMVMKFLSRIKFSNSTYFRCVRSHPDVWTNLSSNWNDFFWLTGELPMTLDYLVSKIEIKFFNMNPLGRKCNLSLRNQVKRTFVS